MMYDGKKAAAEKIVYESLDKIKEKTKNDPMKIFNDAIKNSRETMGCGLFGLGCPDPLEFPDFNKNFQLNNYRRIKLNASKSSWTDIGFNVKRAFIGNYNQKPYYYHPDTWEHQGGDFLFIPKQNIK